MGGSDSKGETPGLEGHLSLWDLFQLFFRTGLNFGGGLAITSLLRDELVERRRVISRAHFLTMYGLARIIPGGTLTAHAIGLGYRFCGFPGSVVALAGVSLPVLIPTISLAALYEAVRESQLLDLMPVTLLPASVALLFGAVLQLGRDVARPSLELVIAVASLVGGLLLGIHPGVLIVLGGVVGAIFLRQDKAV